jgi:hypothetical protein
VSTFLLALLLYGIDCKEVYIPSFALILHYVPLLRYSISEFNFICLELSLIKVTIIFSIFFLRGLRPRANYKDRAPIVGEVSVKFCRKRVPRGKRDRSLRPYSRFSKPEPLHFLPSSSSIVLTKRGWGDPVPDPLLLRKPGSPGNRTRTPGPVARNSDH